jgi:hypothetical protein
LLGRKPAVTLGVATDVVNGFTRVQRGEFGHALFDEAQLLGLNRDVGSLTTQAGEWLVHHDAGVGQ